MTVIDSSTPVVALKAHHGTLGLARSLGRLGVAVHAMHADPAHPALASRYLAGVHRWDFSAEPAARSVQRRLPSGD